MSDSIDELVDDPALQLRLQRHLEFSAHDARLRPSPLSGIVARATRRRRRHRLAGASAASLLGIAAVMVAFSASSSAPAITPADIAPELEDTTVDTATTELSASGTDAVESRDADDEPLATEALPPMIGVLGAPVETWRSEAPDAASAAVVDQVFPATGMYSGHIVWTTMEQSPRDFRSDVSISPDGVHWDPVATSPDLAVIGGTERDGTLVLIGYAPEGDPDAGALVAATSVDGGQTWQRTPLGYDLGAAWESGVMTVSLTASQVEVRDGIIVASIEPTAMLDIDAIAGDGTMMNGYVVDDLGIAVLAACEPSGDCFAGPANDTGGRDVEQRLTWEQAGLDERERSYLTDEPFLVRIEDGRAERVFDLPSTYPGGTRLGLGEGGFLALVQTFPDGAPGTVSPASLFSSVDGRSWSLVGRPGVQAGAVGSVGGMIVVAGPSLDTGSNLVLASSDGVDWRRIEVPSPGVETWDPMPYGAAIAEGRIALLITRRLEPQMVRQVENGVVLESEDGMGDAVVYDEATGEVLGGWTSTGEYSGRLRKGDDASMVVLDDSGAVIAEFTLDEAMQAMQEQMKPTEMELSVVVSDDITTWSWTSLNDLVDEPLSWAEYILMTHDGLVIPAQVALDPDFATTERRIFVAA